MKKFTVVSSVLALCMSGCGGGGSTADGAAQKSATVSGSISGLSPGVTALLVNNGTETIAVSANGSFKFDHPVAAGATYSVALFSDPNGNACKVANGTGVIAQNAADVSNVAVTCQLAAIALLQYNVGVTVSGLTAGNSVSFSDGQGAILKVAANGLGVFAKQYSPLLVPGASYNVTVSANPTGQSCTLTNNAGTNPAGAGFSNFINVTAACK
jgi:archaellum component FlaF (FlaF/FlaG flagellin family)